MSPKVKKYCFIFLLFISIHSNAIERKDTLDYKFGVGYNIIPGLLNLEAGAHFEIKLKKDIFLELSYVHQFKGFRYPATGGGGKCRSYVPAYGELFKAGIRKYRYSPKNGKLNFIEYRIGYNNINIPQYTGREGSCGLDLVAYREITVHIDSYRTTFIIGRKNIYRKNFYVEKSIGLGMQLSNKKEHLYSSEPRDSPEHRYIYPENTIDETWIPYPLLEVSLLIGFGL